MVNTKGNDKSLSIHAYTGTHKHRWMWICNQNTKDEIFNLELDELLFPVESEIQD